MTALLLEMSITHDTKTHIAYDCTTSQTTALPPMMYRFIRANLASCSVFPIIVDAINTCTLILKLLRSTTVFLDTLSEYTHAGTL